MPFNKLGLHPELVKNVHALGFTKPTAIQAASIPAAVEGRDLLAGAETGSGKTAAFLLPILHRMLLQPKNGTRCLILAPTRELAQQIADDFLELTPGTALSVAPIYGGVGMGPQLAALRRGVHVIAATPGRLLDHMNHGVHLKDLDFLVLDEADRMLDMGFLPDIKRILAKIPAKRQTLFFSATLPPEVKALATSLLRNPEVIQTERQAPPAMVDQGLMSVHGNRKAELLIQLLGRPEMKQAIVFTRTKQRANRLAELLMKRGVNAQRIHGNRSQAQRTEALKGFKSGKYRVLVATDLASRGIDVEALGHVVNFDVPVAPEDYIHRIGRTGRAGVSGTAWTLVAPDEEPLIRAIERILGKKLRRETVEGFGVHDAPTGKEEALPPVRDRRFAPQGRNYGPRGGGGGRGRPHGGGGHKGPGGHSPRAHR
ncbi:MAG: DEAD/DEAH box helicase [Spirochaetes bacterium]|nr:DEAD/DEAH box helicase [Spirochaetota bacterium]